MLRGWRGPVDGIFEIGGRDGGLLILLNLVDDREYRTYSSMGPGAFRPLPRHGLVYARLVPAGPVPDAWLVCGAMRAYRKSDAAQAARAALELAARLPGLVRRNPEKVEQGWQQMRADRAAFVEFFGRDELVLSPAEAEERINAFCRHRQEAALAARSARRRPPAIPGRGCARVRASARARRRRGRRRRLRRDRRGRKSATLSDKTARSQYGLTQEEIYAAIDAGKVRYRPAAMHGNPWLRLLRREVEDLVRARSGDRYLRERKARTELAQTDRELKQLRVQLAALEERRAALLAELAGQADHLA